MQQLSPSPDPPSSAAPAPTFSTSSSDTATAEEAIAPAHASSHGPSTQSTDSTDTYTPGPLPPELPYSIKDHKTSIIILWSFLALDSVILPIALFYPLWYSTHLRQAIIFAITTSVFGIISGLEWAYRSFQLMSKQHVRPLGCLGPNEEDEHVKSLKWYNRRKYYWGFDFFHFSYSTGYMFALGELIVGAAPHHPFVRLCAAPSPTFITIFGTLMLTTTTYHHLHLPAPFRISSTPRGAPVMPATYTILEDVLSVDTGVGRRYRHALRLRYDKSRKIRRLLRQMDLFWGVPALLLGVGLLASIGDHRIEQALSYGLGWGIPPAWAATWAIVTTVWVKNTLWREKRQWRSEWEDLEKQGVGGGEGEDESKVEDGGGMGREKNGSAEVGDVTTVPVTDSEVAGNEGR